MTVSTTTFPEIITASVNLGIRNYFILLRKLVIRNNLFRVCVEIEQYKKKVREKKMDEYQKLYTSFSSSEEFHFAWKIIKKNQVHVTRFFSLDYEFKE